MIFSIYHIYEILIFILIPFIDIHSTWSCFVYYSTYKLGETKEGSFEAGIAGIAKVGQICQTHIYAGQVLKCGLLTDIGNYQAIRTAAHELGHMCVLNSIFYQYLWTDTLNNNLF